MKKQHRQSAPAQATDGVQPLIVWGERRKDPDWDSFIAALIAYALREVEDQELDASEGSDA